MAEVSLEQITSGAREGRPVLDGLDLRIGDGEILALLGASGSGKTTLLRIVAGLQPPDQGTVRIGGRDVTAVATRDRDVAMVVQDDALLPHLTVAGNVGFGLRLRRLGRREVEKRVGAETRVLRIGDLLDRRPGTLSGGERQATAVARATVRAPAVYLLDEPFARADAHERARLRRDLTQVMRWRGCTALLVTNDPMEAMAVGDRLAVLLDGRIAQAAPPQEVYERPTSVAVAQQVSPLPLSVLPGVLEVGRTTSWVRLGSQRVQVLPPPAAARHDLEGTGVLLGVRPERARPAAEEPGALVGRVAAVQHLGSHVLAEVGLDGLPAAPLLARLPTAPPPGNRIALRLDPAGLLLFDAATGLPLPG